VGFIGCAPGWLLKMGSISAMMRLIGGRTFCGECVLNYDAKVFPFILDLHHNPASI